MSLVNVMHSVGAVSVPSPEQIIFYAQTDGSAENVIDSLQSMQPEWDEVSKLTRDGAAIVVRGLDVGVVQELSDFLVALREEHSLQDSIQLLDRGALQTAAQLNGSGNHFIGDPHLVAHIDMKYVRSPDQINPELSFKPVYSI